MYSNSSPRNYIFVILGLFAIFLGVFFYFFNLKNDNQSFFWEIFIISCLSFIINIGIIVSINFKNKTKLLVLIIFSLLFISSLQVFESITLGIVYLLLSVVSSLILGTLPMSSSLKYFNIGMLVTISSFLYFPTAILLLLFFIVTVLYYEEKINISQYLAGIFVTLILIIEIMYLTDQFYRILDWVNHFEFPRFHFEYQIPILIALVFILIYGFVNQYTNKKDIHDLKILNGYSVLLLYLFSWIVIYAFFMGDNYGLLLFVSLSISLIVSKSL